MEENNGHWIGALKAEDWVKSAKINLSNYFSREVIVISLIGKNFPNRMKFEKLNDFLKIDVFPSPSTSQSELNIDMYYSASDSIVFLLIDSPNDLGPLKETLGQEGKTFFEKLGQLEVKYYELLHFATLISHFLVVMEPYPRLDMSLVRTFKNVNKIRLSAQKMAKSQLSTSENIQKFFKGGRLATPEILFAFEKTVIRSELSLAKRKDIVEKLEESIENQIYNVFRQCRLIGGGSDSSFGSLPEKLKYVRLLFPSKATENIMSDLLDFVMDKDMSDGEDEAGSEGFAKLIGQNVAALRRDKEKSLPTLESLIEAVELLFQVTETIKTEQIVDKIVFREQDLFNELNKMALDESVEQYSWSYGKESNRAVFTKAEHNQRFGAAVRYLDGVLAGGPRDAVMAELRSRCDNLWQGGLQCCEQQSVTGFNCHLAVHSTVGDESVAEKEWEMHDSRVTYLSTCACGRSQTIRKDPFSVKEANFDFYHQNSVFTCCRNLERHNFPVVGEYEEEVETEENWHADENWPRPGDEAPVPFSSRRNLNPSSSEESISESQSSSSSESESTGTESEGREEYRSSRRSYVRKEPAKVETRELRQSAAWEYMKKCRDLVEKNIAHTEDVPHSSVPGILPVFPSFSLTCIGPGSLYSHGLGLKDQPNFKISSEFLLPVDIPLMVDRGRWEQDLEFVNAMEGVGMYTKYRPSRRPGLDTEKVKLFVGFDYECPRGHRFFVDSQGEPLLLPKGQTYREQACKDAGTNIMSVDLPLRRQCTCRKQPSQVAQLMKIHIVTPKSPVSVTVDPKIVIPGQEGFYYSGEGPLKLAWAKYYILHLPFVYSGPNGLWIPPKTFDRVGTFLGNSIQVTYTPLEKK